MAAAVLANGAANGAAPKQHRPSKNQKRRARAQQKKKDTSSSTPVPESTEPTPEAQSAAEPYEDASKQEGDTEDTTNVEDLTDLSTDLDLNPDDPLYQQFKHILDKQQALENEGRKEPQKPEIYYGDEEDDIPEEEDDKPHKMSKKQRKEAAKLSIAELKAIVERPELVDWTDVSSSDPRLLVSIKASKNAVPVPPHWSLKREYLSSKRGIEKPPFQLPKFIQDTGIAEMRDANLEKQQEQSLKQRQRERVQPKMGRLDIDYQKMYEAFFRLQTKPELTHFGEMYYEGKEFETNLRHLRPGELSEELKKALSMPEGAPPPWLINQQRHGPPPSYPALKIPGLNAPPPAGGSWGYQPGGWGKPPLDEHNRPLYGGEVFGKDHLPEAAPQGEPVEKTLWGELRPQEDESEDEEEEAEEEEEDEEEDVGELPGGTETPFDASGGMASQVPPEYPGQDRTEGDFSLRKSRRSGTETEEPARTAYTVLPEHNIRNTGFFGGERAYDLGATKQNPNVPMLGSEENKRKRKVGDVDVAVDVDALERDDKLTREEVKKRYESGRQEQANPGWGAGGFGDDLDAMIAEESNKRLKQDQEKYKRRKN